MNEKELQEIVLRVVLAEVARAGEHFVPVTSSNRHVHLCQGDVERLFGKGYQLKKLRDLVQPGQYACQETVVLETAKGRTTLRVVGPIRKETQIELSYTDCYKLGLEPVLRMSGETAGTPGCVLLNGDQSVTLARGVMVAKRHLHMSREEAEAYGLRDGDVVALQAEGERAVRLENLVVRSGDGHSLEAHIDKDEANACGLRDGQLCRIRKERESAKGAGFSAAGPKAIPPPVQQPPSPRLYTYVPQAVKPQASEAPPGQPLAAHILKDTSDTKTKLLDLSNEPHCLIAEEDVLSALRNGYKLIRYGKGAVITPLARDVASAKGLEFIELT